MPILFSGQIDQKCRVLVNPAVIESLQFFRRGHHVNQWGASYTHTNLIRILIRRLQTLGSKFVSWPGEDI